MERLKTALSFGGILNKEEVDEAVLHFEPRCIKAGDDFVSIGRVTDELGFIDEGIIRGFIRNKNGEEATKYFLRQNQFIMDIESYYNNSPSENGFQAMVDTSILSIRRKGWNELTEKFPKLYILTKSLTEAALLNKIKDNDFLNFGTASEKYKEFMRRYPDVALQVPQQYIASYLKITPQSLSRIRKEMGKKK